ncbi:MAG: hypothetical protein QOH25_1081 [Acidobacteriota bacterium]|jgi:hypothetical protein|nr:hypothetical protein [Acidobacteriota bacterium]
MQTKILAVFLVLTITALASGFQSSAEWMKYTSEEGHYIVLVPQQPKLSSQEVPAPDGTKFTQYMAQASDADSFYLLGYFDYTPNMVFSLDKARDGMLEATKGTLLKEEAISLGVNSGKELKVSTTNEGFDLLIRIRFYEVGRRIYVLQHIFQKSAESPAIATKTTKFFDSFKIMPVK